MVITVVISTWQVPFDQVVKCVHTFAGTNAAKQALDLINEESAKWWAENDGDRSVASSEPAQPYEPITELGYSSARYELWGGEAGFHAMLDEASYAQLHEEHYAREFDDKGIDRPGYLINAYVAGHKPGGMTEDEAEKYTEIRAEKLAELSKHFSKKSN